MSRPPGSVLARLADFASAFRVLLSGERLIELVVALALLGGALMVLADFVTLFEIKTRGTVIKEQTGGDQHAYAVAVIGVIVIAAALVARAADAWPPAGAAAVLALAAFAIALIFDLPDATRSGDLVAGARAGDTSPAGGFWLELAGASIALGAAVTLVVLLRRRGAGGRASGYQR